MKNSNNNDRRPAENSAQERLRALDGRSAPKRGRCWIVATGCEESEVNGSPKARHWVEVMCESGETDRLGYITIGDPAFCRTPSWREVAAWVGYTLVEAPDPQE